MYARTYEHMDQEGTTTGMWEVEFRLEQESRATQDAKATHHHVKRVNHQDMFIFLIQSAGYFRHKIIDVGPVGANFISQFYQRDRCSTSRIYFSLTQEFADAIRSYSGVSCS